MTTDWGLMWTAPCTMVVGWGELAVGAGWLLAMPIIATGFIIAIICGFIIIACIACALAIICIGSIITAGGDVKVCVGAAMSADSIEVSWLAKPVVVACVAACEAGKRVASENSNR